MLFLIQKFTAISRFASEKYCALCVCFSRKVVFSLPKEVVSYFIPSSDLPLLPPHTSCLPFHWQKTATIQESASPTPPTPTPTVLCVATPVFSFLPVVLPEACPSWTTSHHIPFHLVREHFLFSPLHLSLGSFLPVYKHALVQCCPVELSTLMETFLSTWSCMVVTSYLRLWGTWCG